MVGGTYSLSVYSSDGIDLYRTISGSIDSAGNILALWDSKDDDGHLLNLATGDNSFGMRLTVTDTQGNSRSTFTHHIKPMEPYPDTGKWVVSYDSEIFQAIRLARSGDMKTFVYIDQPPLNQQAGALDIRTSRTLCCDV